MATSSNAPVVVSPINPIGDLLQEACSRCQKMLKRFSAFLSCGHVFCFQCAKMPANLIPLQMSNEKIMCELCKAQQYVMVFFNRETEIPENYPINHNPAPLMAKCAVHSIAKHVYCRFHGSLVCEQCERNCRPRQACIAKATSALLKLNHFKRSVNNAKYALQQTHQSHVEKSTNLINNLSYHYSNLVNEVIKSYVSSVKIVTENSREALRRRNVSMDMLDLASKRIEMSTRITPLQKNCTEQQQAKIEDFLSSLSSGAVQEFMKAQEVANQIARNDIALSSDNGFLKVLSALHNLGIIRTTWSGHVRDFYIGNKIDFQMQAKAYTMRHDLKTDLVLNTSHRRPALHVMAFMGILKQNNLWVKEAEAFVQRFLAQESESHSTHNHIVCKNLAEGQERQRALLKVPGEIATPAQPKISLLQTTFPLATGGPVIRPSTSTVASHNTPVSLHSTTFQPIAPRIQVPVPAHNPVFQPIAPRGQAPSTLKLPVATINSDRVPVAQRLTIAKPYIGSGSARFDPMSFSSTARPVKGPRAPRLEQHLPISARPDAVDEKKPIVKVEVQPEPLAAAPHNSEKPTANGNDDDEDLVILAHWKPKPPKARSVTPMPHLTPCTPTEEVVTPKSTEGGSRSDEERRPLVIKIKMPPLVQEQLPASSSHHCSPSSSGTTGNDRAPSSSQHFSPIQPKMEDDVDSVRSMDSDGTHKYCFVCGDTGEGETEKGVCSNCPRSYHRECIAPKYRQAWSEASDDWRCTLCDDEPKSTEPPTDGGMSEKERFDCAKVLMATYGSTKAFAFYERVPADTPGYYDVIEQPMELKSVAERLEVDHPDAFKNIREFIQSMNLIFKNCSKFNSVRNVLARTGENAIQKNSEMELAGRHVWTLFQCAVKKYIPQYTRDIWFYVSSFKSKGTPIKRKSDTHCPPMSKKPKL